jgi:hypothetical protein
MHTSVRNLFERYARVFNRSLAGGSDMEAVAALYAPAFVGASPAGVMAGRNDDAFRKAMAESHERYRAGTKEMRIRDLRLFRSTVITALPMSGGQQPMP